jgi:anaerobic ribonucleoside-triphosphate reductase activating protein
LEISDLVKQVVKEKYLTGVTFSGGDPFQQAEAFAALAIQLKQHNINIWSYTGYTFEELLQMSKKDKSIKQILLNIDVLIDGKYKKEQADGQLKYRGSANQRIIDVPSYFKTHKIKTLTF